MGRTPGHPWIGESVALDFANVVSAVGDPPFTDFGESLRYRVRDDGFSTLSAGDAFIAGFFDSDVMLSGDDVVASFVLVCTGSGEIRLSGGTDPDWTLDDPADATVPMGTHTVSGATVVEGDPFPSFDVDAYLAQSASTIVHVECLSGTVEVTQVKLRLWPPGGPVGAWVPGEPFTVATTVESDLVGMVEGSRSTDNHTNSNPGQAFLDANVDLNNLVTDDDLRAVDPADQIPQAIVYASMIARVVVVRLGLPEEYTAFGQFGFGGSILQQADPMNTARINTPSHPGTYGLDVAWPPDEVPGDFGVQLLGTPTTEWGEFVVSTDLGTPHNAFWEASICVTAIPDEAREDIGSITFPPGPGDMLFPLPPGTTTLELPAARTVLVSLSHRVLTELYDYSDGGPGSFATGGSWGVGSVGVSLDGSLVPSTVTIPAHRYWSPTAAPGPIPQQWKQRRDGLAMDSTPSWRNALDNQHNGRWRGRL